MFQFQGVWLPDGEKHFPEWMAKNGEVVDRRGTYQIAKLREALKWCRNFRVSIDVGAHVGLWSMQMTKRFYEVRAFEPVREFRDCFRRNVALDHQYGCEEDKSDDPTSSHSWGEDRHVYLYPVALGAEWGRVGIRVPSLEGGRDTGGTHVSGAGEVEMRKLDDYRFQNVDFIKIDCEGYEHNVLSGGRETIERCKPTVIVEQKPHKLGPNFGIKGTPAVDLLKAWGYVVRREMSGDYIMTPA